MRDLIPVFVTRTSDEELQWQPMMTCELRRCPEVELGFGIWEVGFWVMGIYEGLFWVMVIWEGGFWALGGKRLRVGKNFMTHALFLALF